MYSVSDGLLMSGRGVSNIVSTLALLLVVVGIGSLLYLQGSGIIQLQQATSKSTLEQEQETIRERFIIVDVALNSTNEITVYVYNFGKTCITIVGVYVNETPAAIDGGVEVGVNVVKGISCTTLFDIEGEAYYVKVVSLRGGYDETLWKP
jgi:hypothetical protein